MTDMVENIIIMLLTIVVLIGGGYLVLMLLSWGLKLKGGTREDDGLVEMWAKTKKEQPSSNLSDKSNGDSQT